MSKFYFIRGINRDTTLSIVRDVIEEVHEQTGKRALFKFLLKRGKGDVLIHDNLGWDAMLILMVMWVKRYKLAIRLRGDAVRVLKVGTFGRFYQVQYLITMLVLRSAHLIIFNSQHMQSNPAYSFARGRSFVVYNPLMVETATRSEEDIEELRNSFSELRLLTVTNFNIAPKIAPLELALRDWIDAEFLDKHNITWDIVGSGFAYENFNREFADQYERVKLHGFHSEVEQFYHESHVLAYLTGMDAFPNVVLEASFFQLPVITNEDSCGTLEAMSDGTTGFVVNDKASFREAVLKLREDEDLRRRMGSAGKDFVMKNYSIDVQSSLLKKKLYDFFGRPDVA